MSFLYLPTLDKICDFFFLFDDKVNKKIIIDSTNAVEVAPPVVHWRRYL